MAATAPVEPGETGAVMTLSGAGVLGATRVLAAIDGVTAVQQLEEDAE
jgi:putative Mg2+ transporter-C (MgtC) family protein